MKKAALTRLTEKYIAGTASGEERLELESWYNEQLAQNKLQHEAQFDEAEHSLIGEKILNNINLQINTQEQTKPRLNFYRWAVAASIVAVLGFGGYWLSERFSDKNTNKVAALIKPGGNKAFLTLANGTKINLDEAVNGTVANQEGIKITKTADGQLVYTIVETKTGKQATGYNTISTPAGGQYQVTLPDGTKVWLNALSSLKYPTAFTGKYRTVTLTGEGYFEVAKNKNKPFKLTTAKQEISVLGTHFNVSAYADEPEIKTTLVEGGVAVKNFSPLATGVLKPGQQAIFHGSDFEINKVDVEEYIAWKNGFFMFNNEGIKEAMQKLARWYDVEIEYVGNFDGIYFGGSFSKHNNLQETLKILESTDKFKFKIEGRRIKIIK
ncbi:FecR family protein [Pedobacter sp. HDW13]|uniref:FecR family protein n=1 Tax=unclassified Pedobacter TaxID=2628915 RepID=UPI000F59922A|nr:MULTISPECIES: FecR family protein [unclassified Pedobacter]QIL42322.1 FecR family protein [Pedobacter sp. HDW13]